MRFSSDRAAERYLDQMVQRIVTNAEPDAFTYRVRLVEDPGYNAFTPGGGSVYVTTGLLRTLSNEAQVAFVLAHEIAHVKLGHVTAAARAQTVGGVAATVAQRSAAPAATGLPPQIGDLVVANALAAGVSGYGRSQEDEADRMGLRLMVAAGYDPREAPKVFETFGSLNPDPDAITHFFHGSHPMNRTRSATLRQLVAENYPNAASQRLVVETPAFNQIRVRMHSS